MYRQDASRLIDTARQGLQTHYGGNVNLKAYRTISEFCWLLSLRFDSQTIRLRLKMLQSLAQDLYGRECTPEQVVALRHRLESEFDDIEKNICAQSEGYRP